MIAQWQTIYGEFLLIRETRNEWRNEKWVTKKPLYYGVIQCMLVCAVAAGIHRAKNTNMNAIWQTIYSAKFVYIWKTRNEWRNEKWVTIHPSSLSPFLQYILRTKKQVILAYKLFYIKPHPTSPKPFYLPLLFLTRSTPYSYLTSLLSALISWISSLSVSAPMFSPVFWFQVRVA